MGGSKGSTTASTIVGLLDRKALSNMAPHVEGSSVVKPSPPHALAKSAKSMGCRSHAYSGFPKKTICSHLIWASELFLTMTTLMGRSYFTHVANSAMSIENPPSP